MSRLALQADEMVRGSPSVTRERGITFSWRSAIGCVVAGGAFYGLVMGCFGGLHADRLWQPVFSGLKVPLLLAATFAISLPSFFVLNSLAGLRQDFGAVLKALLATQAALTVVLASLVPYTAFWYCSTTGYNAAILFNACMFAVASLAAHVRLRGYYRPLIARNRRHHIMLWIWLATYAFVGIQMGWVLRPFIGSPSMAVRFFREGAWGNAYVVLFHTFMSVVSGK